MTSEQIQSNINALEKQGASQKEIQDWLNTLKKPNQNKVTPEQVSAQTYKPIFAASSNETPVSAALKFVGNVPSSAFNFAKGVIKSFKPVNIGRNILQAGKEFGSLVKESGGVLPAIGAAVKEVPAATYNTLVPESARGVITAIKGQLMGNQTAVDTGLTQAKNALINDPVGQIAPVVIAGKAVAGKGVAKPVENAVSTVTDTITKPVTSAIKKGQAYLEDAQNYATSKVTGFNPETIKTISENPQAFTRDAQATVSRQGLGNIVKDSLEKKINEVSDTGKEYSAIRENTTPVNVPKNYLAQTLEENTGLKVVDGKLQTTGNAKIRDIKDVTALQHVYDLWQPEFQKGYLTPNEFLNFRSDLASMAKYGRELTSSKPLENLASIMRGKFNSTFRDKITGLKDLDTKFAPLVEELSQQRNGLIDKDGNLTDTAMNRIANATGKGKDQLLSRLEEISPGITQQIKILKAVEDIQNVNKVGTYTKSILGTGGALAGLFTGNIPMLAASVAEMILASPQSAVAIIRKFGATKPLIEAVTNKLKEAATQVNNLPNIIENALPFTTSQNRQSVGK